MRRLRGPAALVATAALLLGGIAACSQTPPPDPDITVSGTSGEAPTLTYLTPLDVSSTYREQIWPGSGPELTEDAPVLLDYWIEDATDASLVAESYSTSPRAATLSEAELGSALYGTLRGQHVGARLLQVSPRGSGGDTYPTVTVVDVLPTRAQGEAVTPRDDLPKVSLDEDGAPSLTATGTDPPTDLVVQPLLRGTGAQVTASDVITVQYTGFSWTTGEQFDTTWGRLPVSFALQDASAWEEGLVDQPVGSQVMLVVPPSYELGATDSEALAGQTLVFVIDILATGSPDGAAS